MDNQVNSNEILSNLIMCISEGKMTELEAERLLNAMTRFSSGVPTARSQRTSSNEDDDNYNTKPN